MSAIEGFVSADRLLHLLAQVRSLHERLKRCRSQSYAGPVGAQAMEDHGASLVAARADAEERVRPAGWLR